MRQAEAEKLIEAFLARHGVKEHAATGVMIGAAQIYFRYLAESETIQTLALIYRFDDDPPAALLDAFEEEARAQRTPTAGGTLLYMTENRGLYLARSYEQTITPEQFSAEVESLARASLVWGGETFEQVLARAFGERETPGRPT